MSPIRKLKLLSFILIPVKLQVGGFNAPFYKKYLDLIASEVCDAVKLLLSQKKLLQERNYSFITLVHKTNSSLLLDFKPTACCNLINKLLSIGSNWFNELISLNQSAFLKGRKIATALCYFMSL